MCSRFYSVSNPRKISPAFQKICYANGNLFGHEALMRLDGHLNISPFAQIAEWEANGDICEGDTTMIQHVRERVGTMSGVGTLFVNASMVTMQQIPGSIIDLLASFPRKNDVVLEITETQPVLSISELTTIRSRLNAKSIQLALDDLTPMSALASDQAIQTILPNYIKIDGSYLHSAVKSGSLTDLGNLIWRAHKVGSKVIAEWIESENLAMIAKAIGCDFVQGYWLGYPEFGIDDLGSYNQLSYQLAT